VRVLGVGLGPCELMQGGAANGWEAMIFGGTEGVSSEENALCALDLSPFFLPTLSRRAPPSPLSALSADLRYHSPAPRSTTPRHTHRHTHVRYSSSLIGGGVHWRSCDAAIV
jgi:hypothetical protein